MPAGNAYPSGQLVPSSIAGLAYAPIVETRFIELAMPLLDFSPRIPLGTFSILLPFKFCYDFFLSGEKRQLLNCSAFLYFSFATTYPAMYLIMFHEFKGRTELVTPIGNLITSTKEVDKVDLVKSVVDSIDMLYFANVELDIRRRECLKSDINGETCLPLFSSNVPVIKWLSSGDLS